MMTLLLLSPVSTSWKKELTSLGKVVSVAAAAMG